MDEHRQRRAHERDPSTTPYHEAARELERPAALVHEATSTEERMAEDRSRREGHGPDATPGVRRAAGGSGLSVHAVPDTRLRLAVGSACGRMEGTAWVTAR
jgi:hypothetical protein